MKSRLTICLAVVVAAALVAPTAWAAWSTKGKSMGSTTILGEPSCAQLAAKDVVCATRSIDGKLAFDEFVDNAWSDWTDISGGGVLSDPSCANDNAGNIVCAVASDSSTMTATVYDGKKWSAYVDSGKQISSAPSCSLLKNGKLLCAARYINGSMVSALFSAGAWSKIIVSKATLTTGPSCAGDNDGDVICAMAALASPGNNTIIANRFSGSKFDGFLTLQANLSGDAPICNSLGVKGQVMCFVRASNTAIYRNMFKSGIWQNSNWTGWGNIAGGESSPRISCGMPSAGTLACLVHYVGDGMLYGGTFDGTNWSAFSTKVGSKPTNAGPACAEYNSGSVICAGVGTNSQAFSVTGP